MSSNEAFEGKVVLIGLCYFDKTGALRRQDQKHGTVLRINTNGIEVRLSSGDSLLLPPFLSSLQPAPKGSYTESSSGESVVDPDFIANYYLHDEGKAPSEWVWRPAPRINFPTQNEKR